MEVYEEDSPLLGEPTVPPREGLNKPLIYGLVLGVGVALCVLAVWAVSVWLSPAPPAPPLPSAVLDPAGLQTPPPPLSTFLQEPLPVSYAGIDRRPPVPEATLVQSTPPPPPAAAPPPAAPPPAPSPPGGKKDTAGTAPPPKKKERPKKPVWEYLAKGTTQPPPAKAPAGADAAKKGAQLIDTAVWAIPANVQRTLYRMQVLPCEVLALIDTDAPGQLQFRLTTPVFGYYGQGDELFPKESRVIGKQVGKAEYGQKTIDVTLEEVQLPNGTIVAIPGEVGNEDGSNQLKGKTNNHWDKVFLSAVANALVSLGGGYLAGTPPSGEFFLDPAQRAAAEAARSAQQDARSVIGRELKRGPTITRDPQRKGEQFCTIQILKNLQFSAAPLVVK